MSVDEQPGVMAVVDGVTKDSLMSRTERVLQGVLFQKINSMSWIKVLDVT